MRLRDRAETSQKARELAVVVEAAQEALRWSTGVRVRRELNRAQPGPSVDTAAARSPTNDASTGMPASRRRGN